MALLINHVYRLRSHAGTGVYLNVTGNEQVSQNRNVNTISLNPNLAALKWVIKSYSAGYKITTQLNSNYALNYYWSNGAGNTGNCDIHTQIGNDTDSCVVFQYIAQSNMLYKIKLKNYDLFLTASGTGHEASVTWKANTGLSDQHWQFTEINETCLAMPTDRNCNWNQKNTAVTSRFGSSACTLVSGLDVANFYSTNSNGYSPSDMDSTLYWTTYGFTWQIPGPGLINGPTYKTNTALYLPVIKESIDNGTPVLINLGTQNSNHTVMAYGYTNDAANTNDILVYDPENSSDTASQNGRVVDLYEAMDHNYGKYTIWSIRTTSSN